MAPKKKRKALKGNFIPSGGFLLDIPHIGPEAHADNTLAQIADTAQASSSQSSPATGLTTLVAPPGLGGRSIYVLHAATSDSCQPDRVHPNPDQRGIHRPVCSTLHTPHPASIHTVSIQTTDESSSSKTMAALASHQESLPVLGQRATRQ